MARKSLGANLTTHRHNFPKGILTPRGRRPPFPRGNSPAPAPATVSASVPARVPAGVKRNFSNPTLRVRDAREYGPENSRRFTRECTRPRPAGVKWN